MGKTGSGESSKLGFGAFSLPFSLSFPSPGDLPDPGIERGSFALWVDSLPSEPPGNTC